jgi:hypothetical protein
VDAPLCRFCKTPIPTPAGANPCNQCRFLALDQHLKREKRRRYLEQRRYQLLQSIERRQRDSVRPGVESARTGPPEQPVRSWWRWLLGLLGRS